MEIIATYGTVFIVLAVLFGAFMTWGIGANDVANAMGTSVGSGAISVRQAIVIAAIFEFAGAFLAGGHVTSTIRKDMIDATRIAENPDVLVLGMLSAVLAAAIWLLAATRRGWPVSTTHTIVGAIIGFAIVGVGFDAVHWTKVGTIAASWVVSPVCGAIGSFLLMMSIRYWILDTDSPYDAARRLAPGYAFLVGFIICLVTVFKGLKHLGLDLTTGQSVVAALIFGTFIAIVAAVLVSRVERPDAEVEADNHFAGVERVFAPLMIFTACAMAFAHGANDVANGIGPMAAVVSVVGSGGEVLQKSEVPIWILALGGGGIVVGLATLGHRVMRTIGEEITALTPSRGFCATLGAAATVVVASRAGLPISTTHVAVGSVIGVGLGPRSRGHRPAGDRQHLRVMGRDPARRRSPRRAAVRDHAGHLHGLVDRAQRIAICARPR